jgi:hypothetical protein
MNNKYIIAQFKERIGILKDYVEEAEQAGWIENWPCAEIMLQLAEDHLHGARLNVQYLVRVTDIKKEEVPYEL